MCFLEAEEQVFLSKNNITGECGKCGHKHAQYREKLTFARAAFVPVYPTKVICELHCHRCNRNTALPAQHYNLVPLYAIAFKFIGLVLLCAAVNYGWAKYQNEKREQLKLAQAPKINDFYFIDKNRFTPQAKKHFSPYQVARVTEVTETDVTINLGSYQYQRKSGLVRAIRSDFLMAKDYFSQTTATIPRNEIIQLFENAAIYEVHRPQGVSIYGGIVMMEQRLPETKQIGIDKQNAEAIRLYHQGNFLAALDLFKKSAERGNPWAQYNLAQMYRDGEGTLINQSQANFWFAKAAEQGVGESTQPKQPKDEAKKAAQIH